MYHLSYVYNAVYYAKKLYSIYTVLLHLSTVCVWPLGIWILEVISIQQLTYLELRVLCIT